MFQCFLISLLIAAVYGVRHDNLPVFPGRVVGGAPTDISQVPYQLQLEDNGFQFCGASIISAQYVLTAAHCTDGRSPYGLQVRSGSSFHASGGSVTQVAAIFQHPLYNRRTTDFDISVLRLVTPITLGPFAQAVQLAAVEPSAGQSGLVSGWGIQVEGSASQPQQLLSVDIPILGRQSCASVYDQLFTSRMICAGQPGRDSCQGDSGGPLVSNGVQVGVVSWGYGCARPGYPGVYTNVAQLRSYIDGVTGNAGGWA